MALCNPVEPSTLSMRVSSHDPKANTIARVARPKASESRDAVRRSQKAADLSSSLVRRLLTLNCVYAVSVLVSTLYLSWCLRCICLGVYAVPSFFGSHRGTRSGGGEERWYTIPQPCPCPCVLPVGEPQDPVTLSRCGIMRERWSCGPSMVGRLPVLASTSQYSLQVQLHAFVANSCV